MLCTALAPAVSGQGYMEHVTSKSAVHGANLGKVPIREISKNCTRNIEISKFEFWCIPIAMATSESAPATYKQPSRKGKKAWRKNVDVTEIQEGLEEVRDQIIQG
jgi:hypothetical protein